MVEILLPGYQQELLNRRITELTLIAMEIKRLRMNKKWTELFTRLCFYRGWVVLTEEHKEMMLNIASTDSEAVLYLGNYGKKVGLHLLENLSVKTDSESQRLKAVELIATKGVKHAKNDIDLLLAEADKMRSLFDYEGLKYAK